MAINWETLPEDVKNKLSVRQRDFVNAAAKCKNMKAIADVLGIDVRNAHYLRDRTVRALSKMGYTEHFNATRFVDPGQEIIGKSTLTKDEEGNPVWIKTKAEKEKIKIQLREFVEALRGEIVPAKPKKLDKQKKHDPGLLTKIYLGDAHVGMRAYSKETKHSDFDTDIAVSQIQEAFDYLIDKAPSTELAVLVDVGDSLHVDSSHQTTYAGTPQDFDSRLPSVMRKLAYTLKYGVDRLLEKHKKVYVIKARGNHDTDSSSAIQLILEAFYINEPRVEVLDTESDYHYFEWGKWLFGTTHGDKQVRNTLHSIMAEMMPAAWGRTTHRLWETGHFHAEKVVSYPGCKVKTFAALPPPDRWHAGKGYSGGGEMEMIVYREEGGIHSSYVFDIPRPEIEPDVRIA